MGKWTQGPWRWSDDYQSRDGMDTWSLLGADGFGILSCDGECNSPQELNSADARLIAAAPELVEALMAFVEYNDMADSGCCDVATMIAYADALEKARAALAKAGAV